MATSTKATTQQATDFPILEEEPVFKRATGRAKSPLRTAMEALPTGKSMVGATLSDDPADEKANTNTLNSVRQKAQEIRQTAKKDGQDVRFSIRVDVENRVIVTRKS
jgi:hypothetical protein